MSARIVACVFLAAMACTACADDDPIEQIDESMDCDEICDRYQDCFDEEYDAEACYDNCTDRADDPDHGEQEELCSDCIDGLSCGSATFECTDDCLGIVP